MPERTSHVTINQGSTVFINVEMSMMRGIVDISTLNGR